ncbi:MAG TPA: SRPBCC domain-containing protein [Gemmatimonadaceae bacterium]
MADIIHRVGIKAPVSDVFAAVSTVDGVAGWWTKETTGSGNEIDVRFLTPSGKELGGMAMEVTEVEPNRKVQWRFKSGPEEWLGTDATFDLYQDGENTILLFGHRNWREPVEFMAHCSMKWATFMLSLKELVETGRGKPSPNDIKIDNWN